METSAIPPYFYTKLPASLNVENMVSFHYYEYATHFYGILEAHDFWEMVYADSGTLHCYAGEEEIQLSQGQAILHPPMEAHRIAALRPDGRACIFSFTCPQLEPERFRGRVLTLDESEKDLVAQLYHEGRLIFTPPYNIPYQSKLYLCEHFPFGALQRIRNLLESLLILFVRGDENHTWEQDARKMPLLPSTVNETALVTSIIALLKAHLNHNLSMEEISRITSFSPSHIQSVFKCQTGMSVIRYFNNLKINASKQMIAEGKLSISEIADALGYSSIHYFSHAFRNAAHMSPSEYAHSVQATGML